MTTRAAIYARVSTDRQRERHTIDSQLRLLPEHAAREGWEIFNVYTDDGKSGETVEARPAFRQLLDAAAEKRFDVLLVIDLDRITRSRRSAEGAIIFDHFREHGIKLATPAQGLIDLDDEDQDLLVAIKRELAKWEKRKIVARMMRGKLEAARKGRRVPGPDPYGYRWFKNDLDPRGGSYEIEPGEARLVCLMYEWAIGGLGISMIAWRLNSEGERTREAKRGSRPNGGAGGWSTSTVGKLLHSTTYRGEYRVFRNDADIAPIGVPAIVDTDTWNRAQVALKQRRSEPRWKHGRQYLLSGYVRCGVCNYAMWVVNARPHRGRQAAYYRCSSSNGWRRMGMTGPCGNRHHRVGLVDGAVWAKLVEMMRDPALLADACTLDPSTGDVDWNARVRGGRGRLIELERLEAETLKRHRRGLISSVAWDRELEEIAKERRLTERNLDLAERQRGRAKANCYVTKDIEDRSSFLRNWLDKSTFEERRAFVRLLLPRDQGCFVTLHSEGSVAVRGVLPTPTPALEERPTRERATDLRQARGFRSSATQ